MNRYKLKDFEPIKRMLIDSERSFLTEETNYTRKIKLNRSSVLFSDDEFDAPEMKLINLVRDDAKKVSDIPKVSESDIAWYESYGMVNGEGYEVYKLDIDSAYWSLGIKKGIISERTNNFFLNNLFKNGQKKARLKALGSLATKKIITKYDKGVNVEIEPGKLKITTCNSYNRNIYLNICLEIDMLMRALSVRYFKYARYYYWDCIFLDKKVDINEVVKYVNEELGYSCKIDETRIYANFGKDFNGSIIDVNKLVKKEHCEYPVKVR